MKALHMIAFILVIIGGVNWGLVGINPGWNLVNVILGSWSWLERTVYVLVGLSALLLLVTHKKGCKECVTDSMAPQM